MRHNLLGYAVARSFEALIAGSFTPPPVQIRCGSDVLYLIPKTDRVVIHIALLHTDNDGHLLTNIILREFPVAHIKNDSIAPQPAYSKTGPPEDLTTHFPAAALDCGEESGIVAYFSWTFSTRHVERCQN